VKKERKPIDIRKVRDTMDDIEDKICDITCNDFRIHTIPPYITAMEHLIDVNHALKRQFAAKNG
jgi:hypothetical protein